MMSIHPGVAAVRPVSRDYAQTPMLVYWEVTQACLLACQHCRAEANPVRHPLELTHQEGRQLLDQIVAFGHPLPHVILTGGDPLQRPDLFDLIAYGTGLGLPMSITPSATANLTTDMIRRFKSSGLQSMGLSLDGSTPARHDALRGVPGCFDQTIAAAQAAAGEGMPIQINTLVSAETLDDMPAVYDLLHGLRVMRWSLFLLIGVGRGRLLNEITPDQSEEFMHWVYDLSRVAPFAVKTTEAPHYRRVALARMHAEGIPAEEIRRSSVHHGFSIRDGHGIMFVSHTGDMFPAGFLPLAAGNIHQNTLAQTYRDSALFRSLHEPEQLKGKCGRCEYRVICGGSRARAYARTGDPLESDPLCPYIPG